MGCDPGMILKILLNKFGSPKSPQRTANREEQKIANSFVRILQEAMVGSVSIESEEEFDEDSDEDFDEKEWDCDDTPPTSTIAADAMINFEGTLVSAVEIRAAINHYRSSQKGVRTLSSMAARFRWIRTESHMNRLRHYEKNQAIRVNRLSQLKKIQELLAESVTEKLKNGVSLHDYELRQMAIRINQSLQTPIENFKASHSWIQSFKQSIKICSRRITKFVSKKSFRDATKTQMAAGSFVKKISNKIKIDGPMFFANTDQTGISRELHGMRSLAFQGEKTVERLVQCKNSLTHSITYMPTVFANGFLHEKALIIIPEAKGKFPQKGHFLPKNLVVEPGVSHIMLKAHVSKYIKEIACAGNVPKKYTLLLDSWTSFKDHNFIQQAVPHGYKLDIENIPPGTTSLIQPMDVYFFRPVKHLIKRIVSHVIANDLAFSVHSRDALIKIISVVHSQMGAPCFLPLRQYSWIKCGYLDAPMIPFNTPTEVCFNVGDSICEDVNCTSPAFMLCARCTVKLCFIHFIDMCHHC